MASSSGGAADGVLPNPIHSSSKYKAYVQNVDRALKTFESSNEWADLISALVKVTKVFQQNAKFGDIPKPVLVAKRLSQCLHPALPMGVHVKALEAYRQIFDILGPQLPKMLYLFAVGLFPLMDHCGIKVKSELFNLLEQYLVPLGKNLRPALPGFLAGVLLGLEEGTEFYERSLKVLDRVSDGVGARCFYSCLWQTVLGSPSVRLPAMLYVNSKFDKTKALDDQIYVVGDHVNHMVSALCATADDTGSALVQRHLLDFLYAAFPFDSTNLTTADFVQLLRRCLFVVLRRDMSLNRRLFTWLMTPGGGGNAPVSSAPIGEDKADTTFFSEKVLPLCVEALDEYLKIGIIEIPGVSISNWAHGWGERKETENVQFSEVRVCRLLTYMQDRADIGKPLLDKVLPLLLSRCAELHPEIQLAEVATEQINEDNDFNRNDVRFSLTLSLSNEQRKPMDEVDRGLQERRLDEIGKMLNVLFGAMDAGFIWEFLGSWFASLMDHEIREENVADFAKVVLFALKISSIEGDIRKKSLPVFLQQLLAGCKDHFAALSANSVMHLLEVSRTILDHISQDCSIEVQEIGNDVASTGSVTASPVKSLGRRASSLQDQVLMERCIAECFNLLTESAGTYAADRSSRNLLLFEAVCSSVSHFADFPIFCTELDSRLSNELPSWVKNVVDVISPDSFASLMSTDVLSCEDLPARISAVELICSAYFRAVSVLSQHEAMAKRTSSPSSTEESVTTVLLKPLLLRTHINALENMRIFEKCGIAVWKGLSSIDTPSEHQRLARILAQLHSRKPSEPSSDAENIIVAALTTSDPMLSAEAALTFHRMWVLLRSCEEQQLGAVFLKPFNRTVMLLLGVLADESVSRARSEMKSLVAAWFIDCAKHNDLPKIVQMLCTMLMNPVTSRVSIQYLRKESKIDKEQMPSLPPGVSVDTLVAVDGKQRLYHVEGSSLENPWLSELRNKLLLNSDVEKPDGEPLPVTVNSMPSGDVPNFDEDTDSLDTLSISMEGIDPDVVQTLQYIVDCVVDQEDSEIEARFQLERAISDVSPMGQAILLRDTSGESMSSNATTSSTTKDEIKEKLDSVGRIKKGHRRQDSLQESIFSMTEKDLKAFDAADILRSSVDSEGETLFNELHVHMLLYGESGRVVDLARAETAFRILTSLLNPRAAPISNRMLLNCLVSSGTASQTSEGGTGLSGSLVDLMARHVRAILGQHFWGEGEEETKHRHLTLLELLITISLHFLRSYFLNSPISAVTEADIATSWKCKISALEFLSELFSELSAMICDQQSRAFALFIQSILTRAKLQKCLLHLLLSAVQDTKTEPGQKPPLSASISDFNEGTGTVVGRRLSGLLSAYQRSLLSLTAQAIRLESEIRTGLTTFSDQNASGIMLNRLAINQQLYNLPRGTVRDSHAALVELRAFLMVVLGAFKRKPTNHEMWMQFIMQILPWLGRSLATLIVRVVEQLCKNIETAMKVAFDTGENSFHANEYPSGFITLTMETVITLVHYCVVDTCATGSSTIQSTPSVSSAGSTSMVGQAISVIPGSKGATELFSNLVKVFSFSDSSSASAVALSKIDAVRNGSTGWRQAKNDMLTSLPHALATICDVWSVVCSNAPAKLPLTTPQQLRRLVLDLLSPIAQHHQQAFLQALSLVWLTRSADGNSSPRKVDSDQASFTYTSSQLDIASLLLNLKVIPFEELLSAVCETLKEAGAKVSKLGLQVEKAAFPTEAPLLELVHGCIRALPPSQLRQCWPSVQSLLNDVPLASLPPRAIFLLFIILCDFVRIAGAPYIVEDKTMSRAVQDTVQKLTEAVNAIVGWQLETTTWLKRTLVVKQDQHSGVRSQEATPSIESLPPIGSLVSNSEQSSMRGSTPSLASKPIAPEVASLGSLPEKKSSSNLRGSVKDPNNNKRDPAHSTQALFLLSENLAELVDSVCKSDDKERLLPTLHAVWNNVVPYLKAKSARNARFFLASSKLLALMSSFSYMRPVWKKTTMELLLDSYFFKMDVQSLRQWLIVTDHLMTHDKTSFKDLLKSIAYTPNTSFSIMTSKEQEYEARAQALKRLAFVVLGSELDQYQAQMNDIQERLTENLRVSQSPAIRSAVFLCIRVLLLRLRPSSLVGIWPIMVTELVDVLQQMEQQLRGENVSEELAGGREDAWMQLYLAACKLLETLCTLPSGYLSQFQMCHWAFVNTVSNDQTDVFIPFTGRIHALLKSKYGNLTEDEVRSHSASLCGIKLLTSFEELRAFFHALATQNEAVPELSGASQTGSSALTGALSYKNAVSRLENALYIDFAEHWQL